MRRAVIVMTILIGLVWIQTAFASDFSADMVNTAGGRSFNGKIYVAGGKTRMEVPGAVTITRMDKKAAWVLMPAQKMYMEQPFDPKTAAATEEKIEGEIERTLIGKDTVDGRVTDKYRIVYEARGERVTILQWMDPSIQLPIRTASEDDRWSMEFRNIRAGQQADSLFEIPEGYNKFEMPNMGDIARAMAGRGKQ